ncbi:MAG: CARDB domain-containing protein [Nitrospirota bacterium]
MHQRISPKHVVARTTGLCTALAGALRYHAAKIMVVGGFALCALGSATPASAVTPCCAVTSITKSGLITAKETQGERTFQFKVADPSLRRELRVGSPVYADFKAKRVSLDGGKPCCKILKITTEQASSQTTAGAQTQAVNPDVIALQTTADLVTKDLGFTGAGEITFTLVNRGEVGVNVLKKKDGNTTSGPPISIDIHLGSNKITVQQARIGGKKTETFTVPIPSTYSKPKCLEARDLKVVVDPNNQIEELHDDNNVTEAANSSRPCPDLAIKSIKRHYTGLLNETYRVKVKIINKGNAPSPSTQVWGTSLPGGVWPVTGWPELVPTHTIPSLAPGETTSFKVGGSVLSANKTAVRIILDRFFEIEESDESNNFKDERL